MTERPKDNPLDDERPEGFREILVNWGPAILAVIIIRLFIFEPFRIPSGSMVPTLLIGDHVLVTKFSYGVWMPFKSLGIPFTNVGMDDIGLDWDNVELLDLADPERGDVIVFHYPEDEDLTYIKRVVGLPGDVIEIADNQIILNGERQPRELLGNYVDENAVCMTRDARLWMETLALSDGTSFEHAKLTAMHGGTRLANRPAFTVPPESVFAMGDNRDQSQDSRAWGIVRYDQIKGKAHFTWLSLDGCGDFPISLRLDRMFRSLYTTAGIEPTSK